MPLMPPTSPLAPTYSQDLAGVRRDVEELYRRTARTVPGQRKWVYVQPNEPTGGDVGLGTWWFDTSEA